MRETGTVKKIEGKFLSVGIEMHEGCESCINGACKAGRSALKAYNPHDIDVMEGDTVEIEIPGAEQARGAFWVLGFPLAALFAGYGLGRLLFPTTSEGPAVASAGLLFVIALAVGVLVQKGRSLESLPVVTRKCGG